MRQMNTTTLNTVVYEDTMATFESAIDKSSRILKLVTYNVSLCPTLHGAVWPAP